MTHPATTSLVGRLQAAEAEVERLREAVRHVIEPYDGWDDSNLSPDAPWRPVLFIRTLRRCREALTAPSNQTEVSE